MGMWSIGLISRRGIFRERRPSEGKPAFFEEDPIRYLLCQHVSLIVLQSVNQDLPFPAGVCKKAQDCAARQMELAMPFGHLCAQRW
jgi:hypothetical protein